MPGRGRAYNFHGVFSTRHRAEVATRALKRQGVGAFVRRVRMRGGPGVRYLVMEPR